MIIYFDNGNNPFTSHFKLCGEEIYTPYNKSLKVKVIRKFEKFKLLRSLLYNKKIRPVKDEKVIIFDSNISPEFLEWIKLKYSTNRIIFWYWNPVNTSLNPKLIPNGIEIWSYSIEDCKKYNLQYNTTFYFDNLVNNKLQNNEKNNILFVGRDKGRLNSLLSWKKQLDYQGISSQFYIIGDKNSKDYKYQKPLQYNKIIELINRSNVIIDYYVDEYAGLSLRTMEALFLNKKLITNNKIISSYDFYNENNIYIVNKDLDDIKKFLQKEMVVIDNKIKEQYLFSNWINKF